MASLPLVLVSGIVGGGFAEYGGIDRRQILLHDVYRPPGAGTLLFGLQGCRQDKNSSLLGIVFGKSLMYLDRIALASSGEIPLAAHMANFTMTVVSGL